MGERDQSNIPKSISDKIGRNLHLLENHPVCIISHLICEYFNNSSKRVFTIYDKFSPVVSIESNFDRLLIPVNHPARSKSDTYYTNDLHVLRTHTSSHQNDLLESGETSFLVIGDVYRKDEIDSTHYPVFHQMEGLYIDKSETMTDDELQNDLIETLKGLCNHLFPNSPVRVNDDYFPFTNPSFEMEVYHKNKWIEILGCGIVHEQILKNCSVKNPNLISALSKSKSGVKKGWAFGLGLERLAMILFEIPDIRLMWVNSDKFISQFKPNTIIKFKPYSVLDTISRDVSFYIPEEQVIVNPATRVEESEKYTDKKSGFVRIWLNENDMCEIIRETANKIYPDIVAKVEMFDQFYNAKLTKLSRAYRIYYSPPDAEMNDPGKLTVIVNQLHYDISKELGRCLCLTIR
jgi:phenylalanyl-tRNA synthetase alpha chain